MKIKIKKLDKNLSTKLLLVFLPVFVLTFSSSLVIFDSLKYQEVSAVQECTEKYPASATLKKQQRTKYDLQIKKRNACNKGFDNAKKNPQPDKFTSCVEFSTVGDNATEIRQACEAGYDLAGSVSEDDLLAREAESKCNIAFKDPAGIQSRGKNKPKRDACKTAYVAAKKDSKKSKDQICAGKKDAAKEGCEGGVDLVKRGFTEGDRKGVDDAATLYCKTKYKASGIQATAKVEKEKRKPCRDDYRAGADGSESREEHCKGKKDAALTRCRADYDKGKADKDSGLIDNTKTKEKDPEDDTCDVKFTSPLSWIICPIIDWGASYNDFVFSQVIKPLLSESPLSTSTSGPYYAVWQTFRFLANILLVGSMLMIVYAQARGDK